MSNPYEGLASPVDAPNPYAGLAVAASAQPAKRVPPTAADAKGQRIIDLGAYGPPTSPKARQAVAKLPVGAFYRDYQGNVRRNDNGPRFLTDPKAGNPVVPIGASDLARSGQKGALEGLQSLADLAFSLGPVGQLSRMAPPGVPKVSDLMQQGGAYIASAVTGAMGQEDAAERLKRASATSTGQGRIEQLGAGYEPQTFGGKLTRYTAQAAPGALLPGSLPARLANVGVPAVTSAIGGEIGLAMGGKTGEQIGAATGGLAGGLATGVKVQMPPRRANVKNPAVDLLLQKAPQDPAAMRATAAEFQSVGINPTLTDVVNEGGRGVIRAAASKPVKVPRVPGVALGRDQVRDFAERRATDLPARIGEQTRRYVSSAPQAQDVVAADDAARLAMEQDTLSQGLGALPAGAGGRQASAGLNAARTRDKAAVDAAFREARALEPERAMVPILERPTIAANIREDMADYDPAAVPRVTAQLAKLDEQQTLSVRDLFDARTRLTKLTQSSDGVERGAAGTAVWALDRQIDDLVSRGAVSGDPEVVGAWRRAIGLRREFGRTYEGDDIVARLTEGGRMSGQAGLQVAAEDASNAILGRGDLSFVGRPNLVRDLRRLEQLSGPDAVRAIRGEIVSRLTGDGTRLARNWQTMTRRDPELTNYLFTPNEQAQIARVIAAEGAPQPSAVGSEFLQNTDPSTFARNFQGLEPSQQQAARDVAARSIELAVGRSPANAPRLARDMATGINPTEKLTALIGPVRADKYQNALSMESRALQNAMDIAPRSGSQTAPRLEDSLNLADVNQGIGAAAKVGRMDIVGAAWDVAQLFLKRQGMKESTVDELTRLAVDPNTTDAVIRYIEQRHGRQAAQAFLQLRSNPAFAAAVAAQSVNAKAQGQTALPPPRRAQQ